MRKIKVSGRFLAGENETVGRMVWISPELPGQRLVTDVGGTTVELWFPEPPSADISQEGYDGQMGDDPATVASRLGRSRGDWSHGASSRICADRADRSKLCATGANRCDRADPAKAARLVNALA
jgi:hypothetical protein